MNKSNPLARAWRTFQVSAAGAAASLAGAIMAGDYDKLQKTLVITFFGALGAAIFSLVQYYSTLPNAVTPLQRAVSSAAQYFLGLNVTLVIADATNQAVVAWTDALVKALVASLVVGFLSFGQNASEDKPTPAPAA